MRSPQQKEGIFAKIAEIKESDHEHIKQVKSRIDTLVQQELEALRFEEQIKREQQARISQDVFKEVKTKSNFYFKIDENKVKTNMSLKNVKAPGNHHRDPSIALPHEHVHITHWFDTQNLTSDKLTEIYAYYSHLIDLHISQVRPNNLNEVSYVPAHFNQLETIRNTNEHLNNMFFDFYHRWREPTRTWFSQTQEINHKETLANRPHAHHYDHDKGSEFDVEWTEDQKFPHVADRLGFPILREEPIERILGIERAPAHPGYQFQPFVQTPSMDPDPTLSFEQGDTIYENKKVTEWVRFWKACTALVVGGWPAFYTFEIYAGDGAPSLQWMAEQWNFWQIPTQFQDGSGWDLAGYRYCDDHDYMNVQYGIKRGVARPAHTMYILSVIALLQHINFDYVSKMTYNRDKDLVFVYRPDGLWGETEHVYEVHHLEQMVPAPVTAVKDLTMNRKDGILTVYDMANRDYLKFYGEDKYWNRELKEDFLSQTRSLWLGNANKYDGRIFNIAHQATEEVTLTQLKVDRELQAAIAKHGEAAPPKDYKEEFFDNINKKKREIYSI